MDMSAVQWIIGFRLLLCHSNTMLCNGPPLNYTEHCDMSPLSPSETTGSEVDF